MAGSLSGISCGRLFWLMKVTRPPTPMVTSDGTNVLLDVITMVAVKGGGTGGAGVGGVGVVVGGGVVAAGGVGAVGADGAPPVHAALPVTPVSSSRMMALEHLLVSCCRTRSPFASFVSCRVVRAARTIRRTSATG